MFQVFTKENWYWKSKMTKTLTMAYALKHEVRQELPKAVWPLASPQEVQYGPSKALWGSARLAQGCKAACKATKVRHGPSKHFGDQAWPFSLHRPKLLSGTWALASKFWQTRQSQTTRSANLWSNLVENGPVSYHHESERPKVSFSLDKGRLLCHSTKRLAGLAGARVASTGQQ